MEYIPGNQAVARRGLFAMIRTPLDVCRANKSEWGKHMMNERRDDARYTVRWPYRATHREAGAVRGWIWNVSATGMLFMSPALYQLGDLVEFEIVPKITLRLSCIVEIVRKETLGGIGTLYGARIVQMSLQD